MRCRFFTLDVFTARRFAGNPLAVVMEPEGLDDAAMQAIAREFNLPETVFVFSPAEPKSSGVGTMPVPKSSSQKRFTATRAVSGFSGEAIHLAIARRGAFSSASKGGKMAGVPGAPMRSPFSIQLPRMNSRVSRARSGGRSR